MWEVGLCFPSLFWFTSTVSELISDLKLSSVSWICKKILLGSYRGLKKPEFLHTHKYACVRDGNLNKRN